MPQLIVDRYEIFEEIASGGMATVFLGRLRGDSGFARTVAIKRLHSHLARDPNFLAMFLDEAQLAARIRHPNVVSTLDVVNRDGELFVVMDYVHGDSLSKVRSHVASQGKKIPLPIVGAIISGVLQGLHAAHEAKDERGNALSIVHRDVSPQNVLIGADGVTRVVDFGVAKAAGRIQTTADGQVKGKASYMAPEQIAGKVDRRTDIFAASIILWELLTASRLFTGESQAETLANVLAAKVPLPRTLDSSLSSSVEELVMAGLDPVPDRRFSTAREMDQALMRAMPVASTFDVAEWLHASIGHLLVERAPALSVTEAHERRPEPIAASEATAMGTDTSPVSVAFPTASPVRSLRFIPVLLSILVIGTGLLVWRAKALPGPEARGANAPSRVVDGLDASFAQTLPVPSAPLADPSSGPSSSAAPPSSTPPQPSTAPSHVTHFSASAAGPRAKPKPANGCNPPYWVDAKGKHFKDECL